MKLYLDDERPTPDGWVGCRWPEDVIQAMKAGGVEEVSLDHDLGDDARGTGYDVLLWIEAQVAWYGFAPPRIVVHTANPAARRRMLAAVDAIEQLKR